MCDCEYNTSFHRTYICAVDREKRSIVLAFVQKIADALGIETYMLFVNFREEEHQ